MNKRFLFLILLAFALSMAQKQDEPYEPPVANKEDRKVFSLGFRGGFNSSILFSGRAYSKSATGFQLGAVFDIAVSRRFHFQPGLVYMQKGTEDYGLHYLDVPLLFSLKFSVFRINAGQYFGILMSQPSNHIKSVDAGISAGFGFDIGMFYIGMFYDRGLVDISNIRNFKINSSALGLNFGVNL